MKQPRELPPCALCNKAFALTDVHIFRQSRYVHVSCLNRARGVAQPKETEMAKLESRYHDEATLMSLFRNRQ